MASPIKPLRSYWECGGDESLFKLCGDDISKELIVGEIRRGMGSTQINKTRGSLAKAKRLFCMASIPQGNTISFTQIRRLLTV